jgi:hypothetical protein
VAIRSPHPFSCKRNPEGRIEPCWRRDPLSNPQKNSNTSLALQPAFATFIFLSSIFLECFPPAFSDECLHRMDHTPCLFLSFLLAIRLLFSQTTGPRCLSSLWAAGQNKGMMRKAMRSDIDGQWGHDMYFTSGQVWATVVTLRATVKSIPNMFSLDPGRFTRLL